MEHLTRKELITAVSKTQLKNARACVNKTGLTTAYVY